MKKLTTFVLFLLLTVALFAKKDKLVEVFKRNTIKSHNKFKKNVIGNFGDTEVIRTAKKYLGVRYKFGGTNPKRGLDCSAFVRLVMKKAKHKNLPRTAAQQASIGKHVNRKHLRPGDLIFFKGTSKHANISHVGIFIGNGKFIHASSDAKKVTISNLNKPYYKKHYFGARRI